MKKWQHNSLYDPYLDQLTFCKCPIQVNRKYKGGKLMNSDFMLQVIGSLLPATNFSLLIRCYLLSCQASWADGDCLGQMTNKSWQIQFIRNDHPKRTLKGRLVLAQMSLCKITFIQNIIIFIHSHHYHEH